MFKKLNLLLKSRLTDVLGGNPLQKFSVTSKHLGKDLDHEVEYLRKQINDAVAYEEGLQQRVEQLTQDAEEIDRKADQAVENGDDIEARHLIGRLQHVQQHLIIAKSDLHEHQLVTQDLIQRVNTLDAIVAEAKRQQQEQETSDSSQQQDNDDEISHSTGILSNVLRDTREKIGNIGENITTLTNRVSSNTDEATSSHEDIVDDQNTVNDDLEKRRQRLSRPK